MRVVGSMVAGSMKSEKVGGAWGELFSVSMRHIKGESAGCCGIENGASVPVAGCLSLTLNPKSFVHVGDPSRLSVSLTSGRALSEL